jgi:hypothetical protein
MKFMIYAALLLMAASGMEAKGKSNMYPAGKKATEPNKRADSGEFGALAAQILDRPQE